MIIPDTAVKNRISVLVLSVIIVLVGCYAYSVLPREDEPDITIPYVFVATVYKGVASADIETSVTIPIEKKLKGLEGVKKISSVSSEGLSEINIEFIPGTDIDDVLRKVKDKVDEAERDLPSDMEEDPSVFEVNISELPIVVYSLSGPQGSTALKRLADDLQEDMESVAGVLEVTVTGGQEREILIEVDPEKLAWYHIPISDFSLAVTRENTNTSGGAVNMGDGRYQLRVPGEFDSPEEIMGIVVKDHDGRPVYLKELARALDTFKEEESRARLNGHEAVNISVKKRSGENVLAICAELDRIVAHHRTGWSETTRITKLMNKEKNIRLMVADLENNILSGLILVVGVLLFVLGFRNAIIVGLAIPLSMLISFTVLHVLGITLNMVVLFSLTLALGMLVDNAIVIVENIYRFMEQGASRTQAAMMASSEVAYPVIGSTLTTLAAFFPMLYWPGIMGEFMRYLPLTLIVTLTASLFVALVINPALAAFIMRVKTPPVPTGEDRFSPPRQTPMETPVEIRGRLLVTYAATLHVALKHRAKVITGAFLTLFILFYLWLLAVGIEKPMEFFPSVDPQNVFVNIDPPEGATLDYCDGIVREVEMCIASACGARPTDDAYREAMSLRQHTDRKGRTFSAPSDFNNIEYIYANSVRRFGSNLFAQNSPNHLGIQFVDYEHRTRPSKDAIPRFRERVKHIAGARVTVKKEEGGPPTGAPVNIEIAGDDFATLGRLASEVQNIIATIPGIEDVRDDYSYNIPTIRIRIDRKRAALFGLSTGAVGAALKTAYNGTKVSTYREAGDEYDITVRMPEHFRNAPETLHTLLIPAEDGTLIPLSALSHMHYTGSLGDITRINHNRVVTVKANVDEQVKPGTVLRSEAEALLRTFPLPEGYTLTFTGENEEEQKAKAFLSRAFMLAILLIFLILVTLFNSVAQPVIILTSVILSFGGVFLGLAFMGYPFGIIMSGVGVISLAGVVVNNAIVLIDYTNKLRESGMETTEAIIAAGATRLRPVMLTAVTTVLGLIPMVTGISINFRERTISTLSETSQYWKSMSVVVIFGLVIATALTLVVVPTLYSLLATRRDDEQAV
ncbi:efflux RND transporter permease subunit [Desulfoluna butyratoxydans]|uniref:Acriflavin resistance protein n=1 Tax=Desulfoluna butyratoxydans TaxID=231438 RepID=A0A4U8YMG5_9BACT|nr:efflux RND transporter permease subunit [Desulfoluna butyratoxydans]VFQ45245.1 acriflavin resistance protein [Desulfoluna butyratoxydans]